MAVESLLELIERSGIIAADQMQVLLEEFRHHPGQFDHPKKVAAKLVARKVLTGWQAEQLLNGKHRGFFLGPYRLLDLLGSGGMGTVYLAEHQMMHRRCAIKVLPPRQSKLESLAVDRFYREAQAVAALDHPNIVRAYDVNKTHIDETEVHYLVMEYIDGQDLQRMVERQGTLEYRQAAGFIRQAAEGLAHAHQRSLVHRDIKPANLIVDSQGIVKILDLGLARCFDDDASATDAADCGEGVAGTADYVAPEQTVNSQSVDARADIYSLGHTLYFLLTGRPPFPSGTLPERLYAHQKKSPEPIIDTRRDAPPGLLAIFEKMTAKRPDSRYPSAKHVVDALDDWLGEPSDEDSPWVSAARGTGSSVLSPHRSDAPTHTLRASSEDTELELAPLEDEEPLRTEQAADAASNSSNSGSAPAKAPVGSHHPQSSPPGSLPREDAKAESGAPVLEDLPDLEPLENDLVTALEEDGLMSDLMAGESGAALGGQGLLGSPTPRRRTQGFTLASLLEQPVFWVAVAASLVVVLIVAIVLATISTEEAQRSSEDASQQTTSPTSARSAERVQPSTAENANPPSNVPPPPPPPPPPAGNGSRKQQSEDADSSSRSDRPGNGCIRPTGSIRRPKTRISTPRFSPWSMTIRIGNRARTVPAHRAVSAMVIRRASLSIRLQKNIAKPPISDTGSRPTLR